MKAALPLRLALSANAIFSFSCAVLMLLRPALVGEWLGIQVPLILQLVGIGLVVFAAELIYLSTRQRLATWLALLVSAADFMWVAGSIVLLLAFPQLFSSLGKVLILAVAGEVFVFGAWQIWAAGRAHRTARDGEYRHCIIVETNAPAEKMWRVVGNIGDIKNYMPLLKSSVILNGKEPGVGAVRACESHAGQRWSEECTAFHSGHSFDVRFLTEDPNFPLPVETMRGGWEVTPSDIGSRVMVWWELQPSNKLLAPLFLPLFAFQMDRDFQKIIQRMTVAALGKNGEVQMQSNSGVNVRLLPSIC
ncbi:MAG: SRPBCC family protein [Methylococcaceae bacterium]|nr:SRPBCC family protein [Methylococcaceae bacterium]